MNALLQKFTFYKGKYLQSPQQDMFTKLVNLFKFNIEEQNALEKQEIRAKKKSIAISSYLHTAKIKKGGRKFTLEDLEMIMEEKKQMMIEDKRLQSFEELYMIKEEI